MARYEYELNPNETNNTAAAVYRMVRSGGDRVLDLGSGPGIIAAQLVAADRKDVVCVDSSADAIRNAHERGVRAAIQADLGDASWVDEVEGEQFDVIVMADVLEHLANPELLLESIFDRGLLADGGFVVISIPNAGHEAVLTELIRGRFTYQDTGLLDTTHVRFFTLASLRELLERSGLFITQVERTRRTAEQTSLADHGVALPDELRMRIREAAPEAQTYQFIVKAERADAARDLADIRDQLAIAEARLSEQERIAERVMSEELAAALDAAQQRVAKLEAELAEQQQRSSNAEQKVSELERALRREQRMTADERKRYEQMLARAKADAGSASLEKSRRTIERLEKQLNSVYESRTWKTGRAAWAAYHFPSKLIRRAKTSASGAAVSHERATASTSVFHGYTLAENTAVRARYAAALEKRSFEGSGTAVVFAVYTDDLDAGRGDLYTAVGLGTNLVANGYEVVYLPQERWYDIPESTEVYVAMMETVDVTRLPSHLTTVAWVRNQTEAWAALPWLALYDLVLASSQQSLDLLGTVYPGPTGVLPVGVDTSLFHLQTKPEERCGVASTVNQWGREREVFSFLKEREPDFPLALYGQQRGLAGELVEYAHGPVSFFSLPSLYNQAQIVLDDFNHTVAGYGNVNSRVFEAAACGARVLTNRSFGLPQLGLQDIGVFSSARELFDLIDEGLQSDDAAGHADEVRRLVIDRHSYAKRAKAFIASLDRLTEVERADGSVVISHYPDYRDNPYTEMMWSQLRRQRGVSIAVDNRLNFTATIRAADHRRTVFHLNWTAPILGGATDDHDRLVRHRRFVEALDEMSSKGIPLIWTIHNVLPHECADPVMEAQLRQEIADRVDVVHVMCEETVAACSDWFEIPQRKVRVIPHPSYIDVYPNLVDREAARKVLGLGNDDFVYLHFGQIRPYKGIGRLLDAFEQVAQVEPDSRLLLVGKPGRFEGARQLVDRARANPKVTSNLNPIPDVDIQLYMNAADVVVLPHQTALNSGTLLLAYSYARPVVAAETGCITEQVDDLTGVTFDPAGGTLAVQNAMLMARGLGPDHGKTAYERAQDLHYLKIGAQFAEVVQELLGTNSPSGDVGRPEIST